MKPSRPSADTPVLITAAEPSLAEQHEARRKKYILMMSTRVVCLILAAVCYHIKWLMGIFALASVALPWMAVLIANDRPAKRGTSVNLFRGRRRQPALEQPPPRFEQLAPAPRDSRVVDVDPD